eukprot:GILJ01019685.1.p1 GENE.GILJ01019685.1~~GILJ01019685.1.p1  ORF type:complete len:850 (-),score=52.54 GILJ01019685.1:135-2441(-)
MAGQVMVVTTCNDTFCTSPSTVPISMLDWEGNQWMVANLKGEVDPSSGFLTILAVTYSNAGKETNEDGMNYFSMKWITCLDQTCDDVTWSDLSFSWGVDMRYVTGTYQNPIDVLFNWATWFFVSSETNDLGESRVRLFQCSNPCTADGLITRVVVTNVDEGTNVRVVSQLGLGVMAYYSKDRQIHANDINPGDDFAIDTRNIVIKANSDYGVVVGQTQNYFVFFQGEVQGNSFGGLYVLHCQDAKCSPAFSRGPYLIKEYSSAADTRSIRPFLSLNNQPGVVMFSDSTSNVMFIQCRDMWCSQGITFPAMYVNDLMYIENLDILPRSNGQPLVVLSNSKIMQCSDSTCSSMDGMDSVSSTTKDLFPEMLDNSIGLDKLAFKTESYLATGSGKNYHTVATSISTASVTSMALAAPGYDSMQSWVALTSSTDGLVVINCQDDSCATSTSTVVSPAGGADLNNVRLIQVDNDPPFMFFTNRSGNFDTLEFMVCDDIDCQSISDSGYEWFVDSRIFSSSVGTVYDVISKTKNSIFIAVSDETDHIYVFYCNRDNAICGNAGYGIDITGQVLNLRLLLLDDGSVALLYVDATGDINYVHVDYTLVLGSSTVIASGSQSPMAVVVNDYGLVNVVYQTEYVDGMTNVTIVTCLDDDCLTSTEHVVQSYTSNVDVIIDATLGSDGHVVVAYGSTTTTSVPVVVSRCRHPDCDNGQVSKTYSVRPDIAQVGVWSNPSVLKMSVGRTGNPVVGVTDATSQDAFMFYCGNRMCMEQNNV